MKKICVVLASTFVLSSIAVNVYAEENYKLVQNNNTYCYNEEGQLQTGFQSVDEKIYFFSNDKTKYGIMRTGIFQVGDSYYCFDEEMKTGLFEYNGNWYYANDSGELQFGFQEIDGKTYFFSRDKTKYGIMRTGIFQIGDYYYCFDSEMKTGLFEYNSNLYYANDLGELQSGVQTIDEKTYYFLDKSSDYIAGTGIFQVDDSYYCFDEEMKTGLFEYNGNWYYANDAGELQFGFQEIDGKTYFFSRDKTKYGVMRTGIFQIGDYYYCFDKEMKTGLFEYNENWYYANDSGELQLGYQEIDGKTYFFSRDKTKYGVMRTGIFQIGDYYYCFDSEMKIGLFEYNGNKYYANNFGELQSGFQKINGKTYFFSRDKTKYGVMRTGEVKISYNLYIFNNDGTFEKIQYLPVYYNQKDSRWKNVKYGRSTIGSSGCAPTSMAMAFESILEYQLFPTDVAYWLYYNTDQYNKYASGTSGMGIIYAANHYNVKYELINSEDELKAALLAGKIVFASMSNGKFATTSWNHAILLYKVSGNLTYAHDPLNTANNGWVSIGQVWNERSLDPDDLTGGASFYALSKK